MATEQEAAAFEREFRAYLERRRARAERDYRARLERYARLERIKLGTSPDVIDVDFEE